MILGSAWKQISHIQLQLAEAKDSHRGSLTDFITADFTLAEVLNTPQRQVVVVTQVDPAMGAQMVLQLVSSSTVTDSFTASHTAHIGCHSIEKAYSGLLAKYQIFCI